MPLGTKWRVEFETTESVGDQGVESATREFLGTGSDYEPIVKNIKVVCLKGVKNKNV